MEQDTIINDLLRLVADDVRRGRQRSREEYMACYPGHEALVADQLDRLEDGGERSHPGVRPGRIGPYHLLERLGEGGMGVVYLAERREPIRQQVALKVVKSGYSVDAEMMLSRFSLERQALAVMNHECIAKVLDAGQTADGEPYFVMEYVPGVPITGYCDEHRLSIPERIRLFQLVCAGVQHAHQKGVMHRDLTPSNVLVKSDGERAVPKIIDFGLARATDRDLVDETVFTRQGMILGTLEYMSPEQAASNGEGIDTRTDVYSLGVLLYELLTGERPLRAQELRRGGWLEMQRILREVEPPRPSTRVRTSAAAGDARAGSRRTRPRMLESQLRGDLDWIVMKALAKEPAHRYDSAAALAQDLQRHLDHEPVLAGPPTAGYRLRKLARRYRVQAAALAIVLVMALAAAGVSLAFARDARASLVRKENVLEFVDGAFMALSPEQLGQDAKLFTVMELLSERLDDPDLDQESRAFMQNVVGGVYLRLARWDLAIPLLESAGDLYAATLGEDAQPTLVARNRLGTALTNAGRYQEADIVLSDVYQRRARSLGASHEDTLTTGYALGDLLRHQWEWERAEPMYRALLPRVKQTFGERSTETGYTADGLAQVLVGMGRYAEAERIATEAYEASAAAFGHQDFRTASLAWTLAGVCCATGDLDRAQALAQEFYGACEKKVRASEHTIDACLRLGEVEFGLTRQRRLNANALRAEEVLDEGFALSEACHGQDDNRTLRMGARLAQLYAETGREELAEDLLMELRDRAMGSERYAIYEITNALVAILRAKGDYATAAEWLDELLPGLREKLQPEDLLLVESTYQRALVRRDMGDLADAEPELDRVLEVRERRLGPSAPATLDVLLELATLHERAGDSDAESDALRTFVERAPAEDARRAAASERLREVEEHE